MRTVEQKREFIARRANGESYSRIAGALQISKSTCSSWEREMQSEIALAKQEALNELYVEYGMQKAARIRRLGNALKKIDAAVERADLSEMAPDKLLGLKLKYEEALRAEYNGVETALPFGGDRASTDAIFYLYSDLFERIRSGETSKEQARLEMATIKSMSQAYDTAINDTFPMRSRPLEPQADLYEQVEQGTAAADQSEEEHLSLAQRALWAQLQRLINSGDVDGLYKFLSTYDEIEEDAEE